MGRLGRKVLERLLCEDGVTNIPATLFPLTVSVPPMEPVNAVFPGVQHMNPHADSLTLDFGSRGIPRDRKDTTI